MPRRPRLARATAFGLAAAIAATLPAAPAAAQWTFTRVADLATPVPGLGGETFGDLPDDPGEGPSAFGPLVQFRGATESGFDGVAGLYLFSNGSLSRVVDTTQERPGNPGVTYGEFNEAASLANGWSAFVTEGNPEDGIYRVSGGSHFLVADESTLVPSGGGATFSDLSPPSTSAGEVAFFGDFDGGEGLYLFDGTSLVRIVDTSMQAPGSTETYWQFLAWPSLDGGQIAFVAELTSDAGLYSWNGATVQRLADGTTPDPRGVAGTFGFLFGDPAPSLDAGQVAFRSRLVIPFDETSNTHVPGVFLWNGSSLVTIAQTGDPRPDAGTFDFADREDWVSISGGRVLFTSNGGEALWLWEAGAITRILGEGDALDDVVVDDIFIGPEALSGNCMAFTVIEQADSEALVYQACLATQPIAEVPTLGGAAAAALAVLLAGTALLVVRRMA